jgi:hypothetical protein
MRNAMATGATERERAPGSRPGPESRLVAVGLSGVALGGGLRNEGLVPSRDPRPDRLERHDGLRLGRRRLDGHPALGGLAGQGRLPQRAGVLVPVGLAHPPEQREMAQLDAEEQAAREPVEAGRLSSGEVVEYLHSLPALWAAAGPDGRQALATALFARTEVTGFEQMVYELTLDAIELGLDAALPAVFELSCTIAEFGRGERARASLTQQPPRFLMINRTPKESLPATERSA